MLISYVKMGNDRSLQPPFEGRWWVMERQHPIHIHTMELIAPIGGGGGGGKDRHANQHFRMLWSIGILLGPPNQYAASSLRLQLVCNKGNS